MATRPDESPIAHARQDDGGQWRTNPLAEHLGDVAALAAEFARPFGAADWAALAGLWHDLGKYRPAFQGYIRKKTGYDPDAHIEGGKGRVDHSTAGAVHAREQLGPPGILLAYLIAGHHAGLPDWNGPPSALLQRLDQPQAKAWLQEALAQNPPAAILNAARPVSRPPGGSLHLWLRMLFSCLVDADFLDTEDFMDPTKHQQRGMDEAALRKMLAQFNAHMAEKTARAEDGEVNRLRAEVLAACRAKAQEPPGLFSLNVPTGGGKTLSSLAFALEHAKHHGKRRIIYAIPYTSIIEQTADIFRGLFGEAAIEHHSNLDPGRETLQSRLACENWDAPLVVTTNVQLFESLFAARSSQCRKLHNLANSIIVLDEAQLLPPEFLGPILAVIHDLAHYGVSFVLSTATQPAFKSRQGFGWTFHGLDGVREIIADPGALHRRLKRVEFVPPEDAQAREDWPALAERIGRHDQALAIVNRRDDARELAKRLPQAVHLSANLCGEHRSRLIRYIKWRLQRGAKLCVVSTQLIEAGVDVDFPVVFRAYAGLDSIAQAAGRCNREGKLQGRLGQVFLFNPPKPSPAGLLLKGEQTAKELLPADIELTPELFERYFSLYYGKANNLDKAGILDLLCGNERNCKIQFRSAAENFRLIDDEAQQTVIVRYGEAEKWLALLKKQGPERWLLRKLQRHSVSIPRRLFQKLLNVGSIAEIHPQAAPGIYAQAADGLYHPRFGFIGGEGVNPLDLIV